MLKLFGNFLGLSGWRAGLKDQEPIIGQTHDDAAKRHKVFRVDPSVKGFSRPLPEQPYRFRGSEAFWESLMVFVLRHDLHHLSRSCLPWLFPGRTRKRRPLPTNIYNKKLKGKEADPLNAMNWGALV